MRDGGGRYSRLSEVSSAGEEGEEDEDSAGSSEGRGRLAVSSGWFARANSSDEETHELSNLQERRRAELGEALQACAEKKAEREKRLQELHNFWEVKKKGVESEIQLHQQEHDRIQRELRLLAAEASEGDIPSGPRQLRCIEGNVFMLVSSAVILANVVVIVAEALHKENDQVCKILNPMFLLFYIVELGLKAVLWRGGLLFGKSSRVWWNWLDLVIVISGCIDLSLVPLLAIFGAAGWAEGHGMFLLTVIRCLRLARLARVLKIVRVLLHADLSWAEGVHFQSFMMCVIGLSCALMGLEADLPGYQLWFFLEHVVLVIFTFELIVRLRHFGLKFFYMHNDLFWNWLDFIIVLGGIVDEWMLPAISIVANSVGEDKDGAAGRLLPLLRMVRLLRILRLVRLIKNIPPLFTLLKGITEALAGMLWVLLLTGMILYAFALLAVKLLRDGIAYGGDPPEDVAKTFESVPESIFVLFAIMNGHLSPFNPVFDSLPISKIAFMIFVVLSSWAVLSILTAVVSENMIQATETYRKDIVEEESRTKNARRRLKLRELFNDIDMNTDGFIDRAEFDKMLRDEDQRDSLCEAAQLHQMDLQQLFDILERHSVIHRETFMSALEMEAKQVQERSVMKLEKRLEYTEESLAEIKDAVTELREHLLGPGGGLRFSARGFTGA